MVAPYKSTPVFDEETLPDARMTALRHAHRTKQGVWGVIRVLEGELRLVLDDGGDDGEGGGDDPGTILTPDRPGLVLPGQPHHVEPLGRMRMPVEFHDRTPPGFSPARWP